MFAFRSFASQSWWSVRKSAGNVCTNCGGRSGMLAVTQTCPIARPASPMVSRSVRCCGRGSDFPRSADRIIRSRSATAPGPRTAVQNLLTYGSEAGRPRLVPGRRCGRMLGRHHIVGRVEPAEIGVADATGGRGCSCLSSAGTTLIPREISRSVNC